MLLRVHLCDAGPVRVEFRRSRKKKKKRYFAQNTSFPHSNCLESRLTVCLNGAECGVCKCVWTLCGERKYIKLVSHLQHFKVPFKWTWLESARLGALVIVEKAMTRLLHTLLHLTTIFYIQLSSLNSLLYFDYVERICLRSPSTLVAEDRACPWINQRTVEPCKFDISCPVLFVVKCMFYVERQMWSWFVSLFAE